MRLDEAWLVCCAEEAGCATEAGALGAIVLLLRADRGIRAHRPMRALTDLTGGGLGWLREGSPSAKMTRSSPIGAGFGEGEKISGREKKKREREERNERRRKRKSFGFSKPEFILFSIFQSNISFLRISIRIFDI